MLDGYNNKAGAVALTPGAKITASANGNAIDLSAFNNGANKVMFIMFAGQITDGTYVFKLQDSPDNSTWTDVVAAKYQQGPSVASFTSATPAGTVCKLGYLGNDSGASRYVRAVVTVTGATTGGFITGVAVLEGLGYLP